MTAKGAEKIFAKIHDRFHADGSPEAGERSKRYLNEREDGSKLTARVDNLDARLEVGGPAYYELKVNAKYDGKPTQSATVFFQHC